MHIFLQGARKIGKTTVIKNTIDLLSADTPLVLGGFFTWNGGRGDPNVYIRPARQAGENEVFRLAGFDAEKGGMISDAETFEQDGVRILEHCADSNLIILDELGFLESGAPLFKRKVLDITGGGIPVLGVLRLGDVPWHDDIKENPAVKIYDVNENNRDTLPRLLSGILGSIIRGRSL